MVFVFAIAVFWTVACSNPEPQGLVVSTNPWSGYSGHHVAVKQQFYKQAGLKIQDLLFQSNSEQIDAFLAGKADLAWMTAGDVIQMLEKAPDLKIIFLCDYSDGSDVILGRGIKTAADLKGKTLAREDVLFEKVFLRAFLEKGGLTEKDIKIKNMPAPAAATAFSVQQVDAAVTYEPFLSKAIKEGSGDIIFSSKDTNLIADVLVTHKDLIANRREDLIKFLQAADKGIKLLKAKAPNALFVAAARLGIQPEELREQLRGITLFDIEGNKAIVFNPNHLNNAIKSFELAAKAAHDFNVVPKPLNVKSLYDDSLVEALRNE